MPKNIVAIGDRYVHYKTQHTYVVKDLAHCTDNRGVLVIYQCVTGGDTRRWARRLDEFREKIFVKIVGTNKTKCVRRFKKVE